MHWFGMGRIRAHHNFVGNSLSSPSLPVSVQMGVNNAELFNNLGLCCFYAQQYDMTLACMERALESAEEDTLGKERERERNYNLFKASTNLGEREREIEEV